MRGSKADAAVRTSGHECMWGVWPVDAWGAAFTACCSLLSAFRAQVFSLCRAASREKGKVSAGDTVSAFAFFGSDALSAANWRRAHKRAKLPPTQRDFWRCMRLRSRVKAVSGRCLRVLRCLQLRWETSLLYHAGSRKSPPTVAFSACHARKLFAAPYCSEVWL